MNNSDFRMQAGLPRTCLGNPAHVVVSSQEICQICGTLVQDTLIGRYQVKRLLGNGRGYQVYLATQHNQAQPVLMKVFPPDPTNQHLWEHARQEMELLAELHHSSILPILSCTLWSPGRGVSTSPLAETFTQEERSLTFLMMVSQYAPLTFYHLISPHDSRIPQAANVPVKQLLRLIEQAAAALALAHRFGVVHGALEPRNVLLSAQMDQLWITDFGVARLHPPQAPFLAPELLSICEVCKQRRDVTPYWEAVTEACDQYALAALCYHLFLHTVPPVTFKRILPVIQHALQPDPLLRFQRLVDFSTALAAAFGVGLLSGMQRDVFADVNERSGAASEAFLVFPPPPTASQQASQAELMAGKLFTSHDYQGSEQTYMRASQLDPTRVSAWQGLADTYFVLERYPEALEGYGKVLDLDPNNAEAWFNWATVFDLLGRPDQAARAYARAAQLRAESTHRLE